MREDTAAIETAKKAEVYKCCFTGGTTNLVEESIRIQAERQIRIYVLYTQIHIHKYMSTLYIYQGILCNKFATFWRNYAVRNQESVLPTILYKFVCPCTGSLSTVVERLQ